MGNLGQRGFALAQCILESLYRNRHLAGPRRHSVDGRGRCMDNMGSCVPRVDGILESLPLQNHGAVEAAMAILSPVRGFCRRGASRVMVAKVPNPAMVTHSSCARVSAIVEKTADAQHRQRIGRDLRRSSRGLNRLKFL